MHFHVEIQVAHCTHKKHTTQTDKIVTQDDLPITNHKNHLLKECEAPDASRWWRPNPCFPRAFDLNKEQLQKHTNDYKVAATERECLLRCNHDGFKVGSSFLRFQAITWFGLMLQRPLPCPRVYLAFVFMLLPPAPSHLHCLNLLKVLPKNLRKHLLTDNMAFPFGQFCHSSLRTCDHLEALIISLYYTLLLLLL